MKPRTKLQKEVIALSKRLPQITEPQKRWAFSHCFEHIARKTQKGLISCLECGGEWTDKLLTDEQIVCPHCGTKLTVKQTRAHKFKQIEYFCIVTRRENYQVLRFFHLECHSRKGQPNSYSCREAVQRWINTEGKCTTVALLRPVFCFYGYWNWSSNLEVRPSTNIHDIQPTCIYPRIKVIPEITRNGFCGNFHDLTPYEVFRSLLTDSRTETLLKAGQFGLFYYFIRSRYKLDCYWKSAKIAIRNRYHVEDASLWCDYLGMLKNNKMDILNPKNICPADLRAEHDRLSDILSRRREREESERNRRRALETELRRAETEKAKAALIDKQEKVFKKMRAKFFGVEFTDGEITVKVLDSVREFYEEGKELKHCVFTSDYYERPDSLILSARIEDRRLETLEVSLSRLQVIQCRGERNESTEYHERIIALVENNINLIRKRIAA